MQAGRRVRNGKKSQCECLTRQTIRFTPGARCLSVASAKNATVSLENCRRDHARVFAPTNSTAELQFAGTKIGSWAHRDTSSIFNSFAHSLISFYFKGLVWIYGIGGGGQRIQDRWFMRRRRAWQVMQQIMCRRMTCLFNTVLFYLYCVLYVASENRFQWLSQLHDSLSLMSRHDDYFATD